MQNPPLSGSLQSKPDGMNLQLELAIEQLRQEYPDVEMTIEILPLEESVRELRLQQIRTRIMGRGGVGRVSSADRDGNS